MGVIKKFWMQLWGLLNVHMLRQDAVNWLANSLERIHYNYLVITQYLLYRVQYRLVSAYLTLFAVLYNNIQNTNTQNTSKMWQLKLNLNYVQHFSCLMIRTYLFNRHRRAYFSAPTFEGITKPKCKQLKTSFVLRGWKLRSCLLQRLTLRNFKWNLHCAR